MSDAQRAFDAAVAEIKRVIEAGESYLHFNGGAYTELEDIPEQIAQAARVSLIELNNTQVSDVSALSSLSGLKGLGLYNTQVSDITALSSLSGLQKLVLNNTQVSDVSALSSLSGLRILELNNTQVSDLSPLSNMVGLGHFHLGGTQVSDVSALSTLSGLQLLYLDNTQVSDLRRLTGLTTLIGADDGGDSLTGLSFQNTPATALDPELARLSEIKHPRKRTRETFAYLDSLTAWPPHGAPDARVDGDAFYLPNKGPLQHDERRLGDAQRDVAEIHDEVRRKALRLLEALGMTNEFGHVRDSAERYNTQVLRKSEDISVDTLWSAYNSLRAAYEADDRAEVLHRTTDLLPSQISSALRDLTETHGVFASAFEAYKKVEAIARESLEGPAVEAETLTLAKNVAQLAIETQGVMDDSASGPLADTRIAADKDTPSGQMARRRLVGSVWNAIGTIGRKVWVAVKTCSAAILTHDVVAFLLKNQTVIQSFWTKAMGPSGDWFRIAMEALQKLL